MFNFFSRLHSYVKQNLPYPQEFRYGPGRPPPPHRLRAVPRSQGLVLSGQSNLYSQNTLLKSSLLFLANDPDLSDSQSHRSYNSQTDSENDQGHQSTHSISSGDLSTVERLFANLGPYPQASTPAATVTIDTLFASAMDKKLVQDPAPASPSTTVGTGISLLDTIFASAGPHRNTTLSPKNRATSPLSSPTPSSLKPQASLPIIYSPQPSSSAAPPQILNQDVIFGLLGFPPTRTTSAASTTGSTGAISHSSSREGDNEDNSESDVSPRDRMAKGRNLDNKLSEASTGADHQLPNGSAAARIASLEPLGTLGFSTSGRQDSRGRINGDVTPRAPLTRSNGSYRLQSTPIEATSSVSTVRGSSEPVSAPASVSSTVPAPLHEANRKPRPNRNLVPFASDSELWPYTRGPVLETSHSEPDDDGDDGDIVELNFEETSVLSDPAAFKKALQRKKSGLKGVEVSVNGHRHLNNTGNSIPEKEKRRKNKSKKERDAIARREIEESWDIPPPSLVNSVTPSSFDMVPLSPPASPSPCASPELPNTSLNVASRSDLEMMRTPTMTTKATLGHAGKYVNGTSAAPAVTTTTPSVKAYTQAKANEALNGVSPMARTQNSGVDAECVRESIVTALEALPKPIGRVERIEFVREVLALIRVS